MSISIIVPVYNVEDYLEECLNSLIEQNIDDYEIICVNDGSKDRSRDILEGYKKRYTKIRVIDQINQGLSAARNTGLKNAENDYILFIDSDDYIKKNILKELLEKIKEMQAEVLSFNYVNLYEDGKQSIGRKKESFIRAIDGKKYWESMSMSKDLSVMSWMRVYKKDFLLVNNLFFKEGILHEDIEFFVRFITKVNKIYYSNKEVYFYRRRQGTISTTVSKKKLESYIEILKTYEKEVVKNKEFTQLIYKSASYIAKESLILSLKFKYDFSCLEKKMIKFFICKSKNFKYKMLYCFFCISNKIWEKE